MKKKVILDCDPGVDDALAIFLATRSEKLDLLGVTTVSGNVHIDYTTENALKILEIENADIPVYRGAAEPLKKPLYSESDVHGSNGLGGIELPPSKKEVKTLAAPDYLIEMGKKHRGKITLITIGPLTNVAIAIERDPEAMRGYREIISMGGGVGVGNITPVAEYNYWFDPDAVKVVFDFDVPITMLGLNLTHQTILTPTDFHFMKIVGGQVGEFLNQIHSSYIDAYWENHGYLGCVPHDSYAVAVAADPTLIETIHCHVDIATDDGITRGQTVADVKHAWPEKRKNTYVGMTVDRERFRDFIFQTLFPKEIKKYEQYKQFLDYETRRD